MLDKISSALLYLFFSISLASGKIIGDICPPLYDDVGNSGCTCKSADRSIDLRLLFRYSLRLKANNNDYYQYSNYEFNPCQPFTTQGGECEDVYLCQTDEFNNSSAIATTRKGIYINGSSTYLYFTGPGGKEVRVTLECGWNTDLDFYMEYSSHEELVYNFYLQMPYVCKDDSGSFGCGTRNYILENQIVTTMTSLVIVFSVFFSVATLSICIIVATHKRIIRRLALTIAQLKASSDAAMEPCGDGTPQRRLTNCT